MENKIKYTNDGKKVVVIGNLNSTDKIVQEIFVVDGSEIPSGEHFIVKSLHDSLAISWKEKRLKELDDEYEKLKRKYDVDISELSKKLRNHSELLRQKLKQQIKLDENLPSEQINTLLDFMSGKITHTVICNYGSVMVTEFNDILESKDSYYSGYSEIKLCTIYGKSDGNLTYYINQYGDYSGPKQHVYPFTSLEAANEFAKETIIQKFKDSPSKDLIKNAAEFGVELDPDQLTKYYDSLKLSIQKAIDESEAKVVKLKEEIKTLGK